MLRAMFPPPICDLASEAERLRPWRAGVIDVRDGKFNQVRWRGVRRRVSRLERRLAGEWIHRHRAGDRCRIYFHVPRRCAGFLVVDYIVSQRDTKFATFRCAVAALDQIAQLTDTYAIVCDVSNLRISDRLLARWGWQPHADHLAGRNFIKRFRSFSEARSDSRRVRSVLSLVGADGS
ncbi:MAG TPA: hypothetical protein VG713_02220 [Pirellulales bacterium]|nr:hypothetical protein [Pirellulales bacterium]